MVQMPILLLFTKMTDKFQNKYRIPSARLQNWDYGSNASYFITICTAHREHYFGEIKNGEMILNEIGQLTKQFWMEIPNHFSFVELGNFVVMPNHVHGILIIDKLNNGKMDVSVDVPVDVPVDASVDVPVDVPVDVSVDVSVDASVDVETLQCNVSTNPNPNPNPNAKNKKMADIAPKTGTISTIIRSYKSVVSKNARFIHADFAWQTRFHDHIIRNDESFQKISNYIENNPVNWVDDKFYKNE
jgi:REP element-mobilizing transposase RayT